MQDFSACKVPVIAGSEPKLFLLNREIRKILLVMRITAILLLAATLQVSAKAWSQEKINLSFTNAPLEQVFNSIKAQSAMVFFYRPEYVKGKTITINVTNASLQTVLDICLKNQQLAYEIIGKTVVIHPTKKNNSTSAVEIIENTPPPVDIHGRVVNEKGEPVSASVIVKGTSAGTNTNEKGEFRLTGLSSDAILVISGVGIETIEIHLNGRTQLAVVVQTVVKSLDEVQMIAYGSTTRRFNTGNIASVKAADIEKQPVNNPLLALEGRVAGLFITQTTGLPGSGVQVAIQGKNSINQGNDPFYVIDGVPYTSQLLTNYGSILGNSGSFSTGNPLNFLNLADIESITVLKDADATAIYGSRGANGVILITTKKGKAGQTRVDVNMQTGWGKVTHKLELLNTQQYLDMRHEAKRNDNAAVTATDYDINGLWDTTRYTDWQKELIGNTAHYTDVNATVSGGNMNTQVLAGVGYHRETTVFPGDLSDQRGSLHFSMNNLSTNQKFRMQLTGNYLEDNNRIISTDLTQFAITLAPDAPKIYNEDGSLNWMPDATGTSTWTNPLAYLYNKYKNNTKNLVGNAVISYQIIPNLEIKSSFGYTNLQSNEVVTRPVISTAPERRITTSRNASYSDNNISSWIIEPQLSYKIKLGKNWFEALVGSTIQQNTSDGLEMRGTGYNSDVVLEDIKSAPSITIDGTVKTVYKYNALFGRLNYKLLDKYLLNLTARRDGSSRFGPGNQFHNFGAVGIGWIFSNENIIQRRLPFISFGKLSASYGTTGNDQIGDYRFMALFNTSSSVGVPYQGATGLQPNGLSNAYLQWEDTKKMHFGLNLGLFKDRIFITTSYFRNRSRNELLSYLLPIQTGFASISKNLPATVQNSGWEFTVSTMNIKTKNFSWSTDFNLTMPKNELLEFPSIEASGYASSYTVGKPITISKVYPFAGVNPATGIFQFIDYKDNLTSSPNSSTDQTVLINTSSTFYGGFQNNFRYKSFELDFLFQFVKRKGRNYFFGNTNGASFNTNQPTTVLDRWQKPGDITSIQRYNLNTLHIQSLYASQFSDAGFSDASFVRLKNLSLSWSMPETWYKRAKLHNARLYIQGQNLLTITNYLGLDPETLSSTTLPPVKVVTVGLQIGL